MSLRVWIIQIAERLPPFGSGGRMRSGALTEVLTSRGHQVVWWTSAFDHFAKRWLWRRTTELTRPHVGRIIAIRGAGYRRNTSAARLLDHRVIAWKWARLALRETPPDVMVVSMPPHDWAERAVRYAAARGIPTILDVRDPWPDVLIQAVPAVLRPLAHLALEHESSLQARAARGATSVVGATEGLLAWEYDRSGRRPHPLDRVINTGSRSPSNDPQPAPAVRALLSKLQGRPLTVFVGTFGLTHAPWVVLDAARQLPHHFAYVLGGDGDEAGALRRAAADLPNVFLPGWLSLQDRAALLRVADVGIAPTDQPLPILPNKVFDYLAAGVPVLSQFPGPLERLVVAEGIGLHAPPGDRAAFVAALARLLTDADLRHRCARNARRVFKARFDQRRTMTAFADHVECVARAGRRPNPGSSS